MEKLEKALARIKETIPGLPLLENEALSRHCSFRIGGPVRALASPETEEELLSLYALLKEEGLRPMLLGNGTNILFPDEGLDIFMISTANLCGMELLPGGRIYAQAGVSMAKLASFAWQNGLGGLEFASGIPGSVGGGLLMNAGAYGGELKDTVESVRGFDPETQKLVELDNASCGFGYRTSVFHKNGCAILGAVFALEEGDKEQIAAKMRELNEKRRDKQPLDLPSAGSTFKRPEGHFAAAMIDQAGLKGFSVGGAQVSPKHAGFVVNTGGATAADVLELIKQVQEKVYGKDGVMLEPEIIILPHSYRP